MREEARESIKVIFGILAIVILIISGILYGLPKYRVWQKELKGKADLKEAEWSKQIAIEEAKAELESAKLKAQAEVERAKGVAEANAIIGNSLKGNEAYLRYLWIQGLHDSNTETIYVATETGLPILEAGRFGA